MSENAILIFENNRLIGNNTEAVRVLGRRVISAYQQHISYLFCDETMADIIRLPENKRVNINLKTSDSVEFDGTVMKIRFSKNPLIFISISNVPVSAFHRKNDGKTTLFDDVADSYMKNIFAVSGELETSRNKAKTAKIRTEFFDFAMSNYRILYIASNKDLQNAVSNTIYLNLQEFLAETVKNNPLTANVEFINDVPHDLYAHFFADKLTEYINSVIGYFHAKNQRVYIRLSDRMRYAELTISNYKYPPSEKADYDYISKESMNRYFALLKQALSIGGDLIRTSYPKQDGEGYILVLNTKLQFRLCEDDDLGEILF